MPRRPKRTEPTIIENLAITSAGAEGKAIARHEGIVVFVTGAVPGDVADVQVVKKKSSFIEAIATRIVSPSADRTEPFCDHFGTSAVASGNTWTMRSRRSTNSSRWWTICNAWAGSCCRR